MRALRLVVGVLIAFGCLVPPASAQRPGAVTIEGVVKSADGTPVADVEVSAISAPERGGTKSVKSKKDGRFKIPFVTPGPCAIAASKGDLKMGALHVVVKDIRKEVTFDSDVAVADGRTVEDLGISASVTVQLEVVLGEGRPSGESSAGGVAEGVDPLADASRLVKEGRYAEADAILEKALAASPDDPSILYMLGVSSLQGGKAAAAKGYLEKALELNPAQPGVRAQLATVAYETGNKERAVELLREEMDMSPGEAAPAVNLGLVLQDLGRKEEAAKAYEHAMMVAPTDPGPYMELASLYTDLGREEDAEAVLQRLETVAKPDPKRWFNIGASYSNRGDEDKAETAYRKSIEVDADFPEGNRELGFTLLRKGDLRGAIPYLERYLRLRPDAADKADVEETLRSARKNAK